MKKFFFIAFSFLFLISKAELAPYVPVQREVRSPLMHDTGKVEVKYPSAAKEKEIFSDKDFIYQADAKESKNWLEAFLDWLTKKIFGKISSENAELTWQIVKWTLIGLFIAGIIIILYKSNFRGLLRKDAKKLSGASFTDLPEDIESVNIDNLIEEALKNGNYRLAIRWCFLKSLQLLNQQKQIAWQPAKTNIDYQYELKNPGLRESFSRLSYVFDYVWYGEMTTNENTFLKYKSEIEKFNGNLDA